MFRASAHAIHGMRSRKWRHWHPASAFLPVGRQVAISLAPHGGATEKQQDVGRSLRGWNPPVLEVDPPSPESADAAMDSVGMRIRPEAMVAASRMLGSGCVLEVCPRFRMHSNPEHAATEDIRSQIGTKHVEPDFSESAVMYPLVSLSATPCANAPSTQRSRFPCPRHASG
jgi:hypothetical protein